VPGGRRTHDRRTARCCTAPISQLGIQAECCWRTSAPCVPMLSCSRGAAQSSAHTHHRVASLDLWRLNLRADQEQLLALRWLQHQVVGLPIRHHAVLGRHCTQRSAGSENRGGSFMTAFQVGLQTAKNILNPRVL
jgi:hypothetical protein